MQNLYNETPAEFQRLIGAAAHEWARDFRAVIPNNPDVIRAMTDLRLPYRLGASTPTCGTNPHAVQAAVRYYAVVHAILQATRWVTPTNRFFEFAFGSSREMRIFSDFLGHLNARFFWQAPGYGRETVLRGVVTGGVLTPDDYKRRAGITPDDHGLPPGTAAGIVVLVDVYALGELPFDPKCFHLVFPAATVLIHVGHDFRGSGGVVGKSMWVRLQDKVLWKPDETNRTYAPHDACAWREHPGSRNGWNWTLARAYAGADGKSMFEVTLCLLDQPLDTIPIPESRSEYVTVPCAVSKTSEWTWKETFVVMFNQSFNLLIGPVSDQIPMLKWLGLGRRSHLPARDCVVPRSLLGKVASTFAGRRVSFFGLQSRCANLASEVASNFPVMRRFVEWNPFGMYPTDWIFGVAAVMWSDQAEQMRTLCDASESTDRNAEIVRNRAVNFGLQKENGTTQPSFFNWKWAAVAAGAVVCAVGVFAAPAVFNTVSQRAGLLDGLISVGDGFEDRTAKFVDAAVETCTPLIDGAVSSLKTYFEDVCQGDWATVGLATLGIFCAQALQAGIPEEYVKRLVPRYGGTLFGAVESWMRIVQGCPDPLWYAPFRVLVHQFFAEQEFWTGVCLHSAFNTAVLILNVDVWKPAASLFQLTAPQFFQCFGILGALAFGGMMWWIWEDQWDWRPTATFPSTPALRSQDIWDNMIEQTIAAEIRGENLRVWIPQVVSGTGNLCANSVRAVNTVRLPPPGNEHIICQIDHAAVKTARYFSHCRSGDYTTEDDGYFTIVDLGIPMLRFHNTGPNQMGVICHKINAPGLALTAAEQELAWDATAPAMHALKIAILVTRNPPALGRDELRDRTIAHLKTTKNWDQHNRLLKADESHLGDCSLARQSQLRGNKKLMVKSDEVLSKGSPFTVTGRPVEDMTIHISHAVCLGMHDVKHIYHATFDGSLYYDCGDFTVCFYAVCSADPVALSNAVQGFCDRSDNRFLVFVSGDDSLVLGAREGQTGNLTTYRCLEMDASKMDQHTRNGPCKWHYRMVRFVCRLYGLDDRFVDLLESGDSAGFSTADKGWGAIRGRWPRGYLKRHTGSNHTSHGNSDDMLTLIGMLLAFPGRDFQTSWRLFTTVDLQARSRPFGYTMKVSRPVLEDSTFLKGRFLYRTDCWTWTMLPSRWIKLFKCLTNPQQIYRSNRRLAPMADAVRWYLEDLKLSLVMDLDWFSTEIWKRLPARSTRWNNAEAPFDFGYSWTQTTCGATDEPDRDECMRFFERRYGLNAGQVEEMLHLFGDVINGGKWISCEGWHILNAVDYR